MKKTRNTKVPKGMVPEIEGKREAMQIMKMAGKKNKPANDRRRKKVRAMC